MQCHHFKPKSYPESSLVFNHYGTRLTNKLLHLNIVEKSETNVDSPKAGRGGGYMSKIDMHDTVQVESEEEDTELVSHITEL